MCKVQMLRALVKQRLTAAAEEIFGLFERTIAEYEEELCRSKEENQRHRELLDAVFKPQLRLHRADVLQLSLSHGEVPPEQQERSPSLDQQDPAELPHIKEEQEDLWTSQEGEQLPGLQEADGTKVPFTPVPVKSEEDEEKPQSSQLHQRLPEHMETGAAGEDCGGPGPARDSEPDSHLHPDADDRTGDSSVAEIEVSWDDWEETREPQSGLNFHKNNEVIVFDERCNTVKASFSCSECGERFGLKGHLKRHMRIHTGQKPCSCPVCGKRYRQTRYLKQHMASHTGEKLFSCSVCDRGFSWFIQLKRHKCVGRPSSRLHQAEPQAGSSAGPMETGGEDCGGPEPARNSDPDSHLHPDADAKSSDSNEPDASDDDWEEIRERRSGSNKRCNTDKKSFSCSECGKTFCTRSNWMKQMRTQTGEKPHGCSECNKRFRIMGQQQTRLTTHSGERPFSCSDCDKRFRLKEQLQRHIRTHTGEKPFSCCECGRRFSRKDGMAQHMAIHTRDKRYSCSCSVCDKGFTLLHQLQTHQCAGRPSSRLHQAEPPASAGPTETGGGDCGAPGPARDSDPDSHLHPDADDRTDDSSEPDDSDDAGNETGEPQSGLNSLKNNESNSKETSFRCCVCGEAVKRRKNLRIHMRIHTGEKPYACSICGKGFGHNTHLKNHMTRHTGEKPYRCSQCNRCFSRCGTLQLHVRTHTGEKPFSCSVCDRGFTRRYLLTGHKCAGPRSSQRNQSQTEEERKAFRCSECGKRFSRKNGLKTHMKVHTGEKHKCVGRQSSQLDPNQTAEKSEAEPTASSSTGEMETGAEGEDCGGPGPARSSDPDSLKPHGLVIA